MNKLAFLFAAAAIGGSAFAAEPDMQPPPRPDHLVPEDSLLSGGFGPRLASYYAYVQEAFREGFDWDVDVRAVVLPSFRPEILVGIRSTGEEPKGFRVFYLRAPGLGFMRYKDHEAAEREGPPKPPGEVKLTRCEKPLAAPLALRIEKVWKDMLLETRHEPRGSNGPDGVTFHFSARGEMQNLAGKTWSPDETSKPGMLAKLADSLVDYCDGKVTTADLEVQTGALEKKLGQ